MVVLNGSYSNALDFVDRDDLLVLGGNLGIANASNAGAKYLFDKACNWFVFSDQDTVFPSDYFKKLKLLFSDDFVDICAPKYYDEVRSDMENLMVQRMGSRVFVSSVLKGEVYQVIASGMAVRQSLFFTLGGFREDLFIDWVDMEFCWRAYAAGSRIVLIDSVIAHRLGDSSIF